MDSDLETTRIEYYASKKNTGLFALNFREPADGEGKQTWLFVHKDWAGSWVFNTNCIAHADY